jgi:large subunit ribosomal protein L18
LLRNFRRRVALMPALTTRQLRTRRQRRIRGKIAGTADRPRLAVFRSNLGISAQLIDDQAGKTVAAASWQGLTKFKGSKTDQAKEVGS